MERSSSPDEVKNVDWISKLPDDVLLMILSRLSTEEAMRTSLVSKRWEHLWKQMSHLVLDMQRFIDDKEPLDNSNRVATLITEVLNNHHGHLESCVIDHFTPQRENGMLNTWIRVLASYPSLEVLELGIVCCPKSGDKLKIENKKLKLLRVRFCHHFDGIIVSAPSLDILFVEHNSFTRKDVVFTSPRLQFNRKYWAGLSHVSYNISKEEKSIAHEEFMKTYVKCLSPTAALAVSVDLMSRTEVERLRQLLCLWPPEMEELEISFKDCNGHREEDEYLWEEINNKAPFPNAEFRVGSVWMYNFSGSEEEFALASCLVRQGTVVSMMMVKSTSYPASKKLKIEAAVAKLQALLPDDDDDDEWEGGLIIECF
ncbi:hypothetical protein AALP_AA2G262900 [Arabis alpina]|uniref:F-box domain-containing protein n=1 Tax=Arabis alpina TaxID=50452 RepID=A0A087HK33_ARAAL|nr:hypothetical protein AALP_AA2G262900 [Arabis alpina]